MPTFSCLKILYKVKLTSFINNHAVAKASLFMVTICALYLQTGLISPVLWQAKPICLKLINQ